MVNFKNCVHPNTFALCANGRLTCNVILSCLAALPQWNYHQLWQRHQWAHLQWALPPGYWFGCSPLTPSFHLCLPSEKKVSPFFLEVIASLKIFAIFMLLSVSRLLKIKKWGLTLTSDKNLSKTYVDTLLLAFKNASTFLLPTDLSFPLPLLADNVRIKVSSVLKLVLVLNFSLDFSLFAKLCEYVCIRLLPCWNSFTENVVDWNACVKTLACMLKWSMWCSWISGWFFKKSMKMIGASEFSDGKYLKVCELF